MSNHTPKLIQIPLPIEGATIEIPLLRGHVAIIDAIDADLIQLKWYPNVRNNQPYVWGKTGVSHKGQKKTIHLHRVIFERVIGRPLESNELVDHWDNNPLNNTRDNLRLADKSKNAMNAKRRVDNTSGYKGVYFHKPTGKWIAEVKVNKRKKYLGLFLSPQEAYEAYCKAAKEYYGEFARLE